MKSRLLVLIVSLLTTTLMMGQDNFSYGIKAGLNFSTIIGDREADAQGMELESGGYSTGFHAGIVFNYDIIADKFGVSPEFQFSIKGGKYRYEGPGSLALSTSLGSPVTIDGTRKDGISISQSYISFPVMLYYYPVKRIKVSAGMEFGFLVASTGSGGAKLTWTDLGNEEQSISTSLDYNYNRDEPGEVKSDETATLPINGGGTILEYPTSLGAYYFQDMDNGNLFKTFDMGLNADVTLFATKGISIGFRANYGLLDSTNDRADFSQQNPSENRADKDRNLSFQVSLGFNF